LLKQVEDYKIKSIRLTKVNAFIFPLDQWLWWNFPFSIITVYVVDCKSSGRNSYGVIAEFYPFREYGCLGGDFLWMDYISSSELPLPQTRINEFPRRKNDIVSSENLKTESKVQLKVG